MDRISDSTSEGVTCNTPLMAVATVIPSIPPPMVVAMAHSSDTTSMAVASALANAFAAYRYNNADGTEKESHTYQFPTASNQK